MKCNKQKETEKKEVNTVALNEEQLEEVTGGLVHKHKDKPKTQN